MKNIRKIILPLLLSALLLCLAGCGSNPVAEAAKEAAAHATPTAAPAPEAPAAAEEAEEAAEEVPEEPAAYDAAAFDAAQAALLDEYRIVSITEPGEFRGTDHPEIPWYSVVNYLYERFDGVGLYCGRWDFDGNGVPELVMAMGDEARKTPIGVYAFDGEKLLYLCKEQALGERCALSLNEAGDFVVSGSSGAASGGVIVYRIGADGYSTDIQSWYEYEYQTDGSVSITNYVGDMTPEAFAAEQLWQPFDVPIDYALVQ